MFIGSHEVIWDEHALINQRNMTPKAIRGRGNVNS